MSNVKDLDVLVPENKRARLGGVEYELPGDLPLEIYLRINNAASKEDENEANAIVALLAAVTDLFAWGVEGDAADAIKKAVDAALRGRGVPFVMEIIRAIYGEDAEEVVEEEDPTPAKPDGTPSTSPPATTEESAS